MNHIERSQSQSHDYYDGAVRVTEFNFPESDIINDAEISITGRYPAEGYAVNDISLALVSVSQGSGIITLKESYSQRIETGDRILIEPGEPYCFEAIGELIIRYIATPAWTAKQSRIID